MAAGLEWSPSLVLRKTASSEEFKSLKAGDTVDVIYHESLLIEIARPSQKQEY
jgi:hypothetical protein